jgi:hypothetical protein
MQTIKLTIPITVTHQDVKHGIKGNCEECPIALAICRSIATLQFKRIGRLTEYKSHAPSIGSHGGTLYTLNGMAKVAYIYLPPVATEWIRRFDQSLALTPPPQFNAVFTFLEGYTATL